MSIVRKYFFFYSFEAGNCVSNSSFKRMKNTHGQFSTTGVITKQNAAGTGKLVCGRCSVRPNQLISHEKTDQQAIQEHPSKHKTFV